MIELADLMAGPRGRRLCLEIAAAVARTAGTPEGDEYLRAAFVAAYHLDPGAGSSRVMLRLPARGAGDDPEPVVTSADVARLLDRMTIDGLDADVLLVAVRAAVDSARYWQEPDGEDVLAATPHMRAALSRVAAEVVASGSAAWWVTPIERTAQASVAFQGPGSSASPARPAASVTLSRWRDRTVEEEIRAQRERPADPRAAWSGAWWSAPPRDLTQTTRRLGVRGPVGLWWAEDAGDWESASVRAIDVPSGASVYEVDGPDAWCELCRRFPLEVTASRRHDWFRTTGAADRWVIPDWSRVADEFDAVHVTTAGYLTAAGRRLPVDRTTSSVLAGWNPDETVWLTDPPPAPEAHQRWHRLDDGMWRQSPS